MVVRLWLILVVAVLLGLVGGSHHTSCVNHTGLVVLRTIDGDTVRIAMLGLPAPLEPSLALRLFGVDTPESSNRMAKCAAEQAMGREATHFVDNALKNVSGHWQCCGWDKYGGRILVTKNVHKKGCSLASRHWNTRWRKWGGAMVDDAPTGGQIGAKVHRRRPQTGLVQRSSEDVGGGYDGHAPGGGSFLCHRVGSRCGEHIGQNPDSGTRFHQKGMNE
jgi:hypothetical protein